MKKDGFLEANILLSLLFGLILGTLIGKSIIDVLAWFAILLCASMILTKGGNDE